MIFASFNVIAWFAAGTALAGAMVVTGFMFGSVVRRVIAVSRHEPEEPSPM